ncbi:hypothetical protein G3H81_10915 [Xylella fastidiosa subsp. fastidiosa]|uniref:Uncharacterized protein n=1 Tax=Xylella fastidiosa (strain M23) TaxID=405441 RepID=B2I5V7_XYLF2|nr:hypothetical protein [Xylella fastidiosa]ACB92746.1 hypothetical protein XfasM23_1327 [Xylella fastidiosa M23]KAF0570498.1 hypothetical protein P305_09470 [Xylella fastidiosa subsp. fastidiosa Mus-1]EGO82743.1 hypothetical protein XFEB_00380 [Xylella fastidiosa EB92.1]KGM19960.1 hypothetical protein JT24_06885 [Xylella fastidiosa]MBE0263293.1 hypothetical protein [Xylella fastidiosa subsp. fastidiosa]
MNFIYPRNKVFIKLFILAVFCSGHLYAQDATSDLEKDKQNAISQALDNLMDIYLKIQKDALSAVAVKRSCSKIYPQLKEKFEANIVSGKGGFEQKIREEMKKLEASKDPYVLGQIDGASMMLFNENIMKSECKSFAGM